MSDGHGKKKKGKGAKYERENNQKGVEMGATGRGIKVGDE